MAEIHQIIAEKEAEAKQARQDNIRQVTQQEKTASQTAEANKINVQQYLQQHPDAKTETNAAGETVITEYATYTNDNYDGGRKDPIIETRQYTPKKTYINAQGQITRIEEYEIVPTSTTGGRTAKLTKTQTYDNGQLAQETIRQYERDDRPTQSIKRDFKAGTETSENLERMRDRPPPKYYDQQGNRITPQEAKARSVPTIEYKGKIYPVLKEGWTPLEYQKGVQKAQEATIRQWQAQQIKTVQDKQEALKEWKKQNASGNTRVLDGTDSGSGSDNLVQAQEQQYNQYTQQAYEYSRDQTAKQIWQQGFKDAEREKERKVIGTFKKRDAQGNVIITEKKVGKLTIPQTEYEKLILPESEAKERLRADYHGTIAFEDELQDQNKWKHRQATTLYTDNTSEAERLKQGQYSQTIRAFYTTTEQFPQVSKKLRDEAERWRYYQQQKKDNKVVQAVGTATRYGTGAARVGSEVVLLPLAVEAKTTAIAAKGAATVPKISTTGTPIVRQLKKLANLPPRNVVEYKITSDLATAATHPQETYVQVKEQLETQKPETIGEFSGIVTAGAAKIRRATKGTLERLEYTTDPRYPYEIAQGELQRRTSQLHTPKTERPLALPEDPIAKDIIEQAIKDKKVIGGSVSHISQLPLEQQAFRKPKDADILVDSAAEANAYADEVVKFLNKKYGQNRFYHDTAGGGKASAQIHDRITKAHYDVVADDDIPIRIHEATGAKLLDIKRQLEKKHLAATDPKYLYRTVGYGKQRISTYEDLVRTKVIDDTVISLKKDRLDELDIIRVRKPEATIKDILKPEYKQQYEVIYNREWAKQPNDTGYFLVKKGTATTEAVKIARENAAKETKFQQIYRYKTSSQIPEKYQYWKKREEQYKQSYKDEYTKRYRQQYAPKYVTEYNNGYLKNYKRQNQQKYGQKYPQGRYEFYQDYNIETPYGTNYYPPKYPPSYPPKYPPSYPPSEPPQYPPQYTPTQKQGKRQKGREEDQKAAAYQPVYILPNKKREYGKYYPTEEEAFTEGLDTTDETETKQFYIRKTGVDKGLLSKIPVNHQRKYKFNQKGSLYVEKYPYTRDRPREKSFAWQNYIRRN